MPSSGRRASSDDSEVRTEVEAQCRRDAAEWRKQMEEVSPHALHGADSPGGGVSGWGHGRLMLPFCGVGVESVDEKAHEIRWTICGSGVHRGRGGSQEFRRRDQEDVKRREAEDRKWREETIKCDPPTRPTQ